MAILVSDVNTLVKSLVGDQGAAVYTDANLLPYVTSAYRKVARMMRSAGVSIFKRTSAATAIASGTKFLGRTGGSTQYPSDLLRPLEVVERVNGTGLYVRMSQSDGMMEDRAPTALMQEWDWRDDTLWFPGASGIVQVVIEYEADLAALSGNSSPLLIQDCLDAVANYAAAFGTEVRAGTEAAAPFLAAGDAEVKRLIDSEMGLKVAMGGRWGPQDQVNANSVQSALRFAGPIINEYVPQGLSDADLLPFIRVAYRDIARRLRAEGLSVFRRTADLGPVVLSGITSIGRVAGTTPVSATPYPADLLRPLEIMEKLYYSHPSPPLEKYKRMTQSEGLFQDRDLTPYLQEWEWKGDAIRFVGSSASEGNSILIEYEAILPELLTPGDALLIPDSFDTVAYLAASYALAGRPNVDSTKLEARAEKAVIALVASELSLKRSMAGRWGQQDEITAGTGRVTAQTVLRLAAPFLVDERLSDARVLQFMRPAYQDVAKLLRSLGVNVFVREASLTVLAGGSSITRTSTPPLPSDLIRPLRVEAQWADVATNRWFPMNTTQHAFQAKADEGMGLWAWRDDTIWLSPATSDCNFKIQYEAVLPDITMPQDQILITEAATAVAFMTVAYALLGKPDVAAVAKARAIEIATDIANSEKAAAAAGTGNAFFPNS